MRIRNIATIITVLLSTILFSQSNYNDYPPSLKAKVYTEDFINNSGAWPKGKRNKRCTEYVLKNGYYQITSNCKDRYPSVVHKLYLNTSKDFEFEIKFLVMDALKERGGGTFIWGVLNKKSINEKYFGFAISTNQEYAIVKKEEKDKLNFIESIKYEKSIIKDYYNTLTIRKVKNMYYFFLNQKLISSAPFQPFFGERYGFISENASIRIDYVKAYLLLPREENEPPVISLLEPESKRGFNIVNTKTIKVKGQAIDSDGIRSVKINKTDARLFNNGEFEANMLLDPGLNELNIVATDKKGLSKKEIFEINYESPRDNSIISDDKDKNSKPPISNLKVGKYYALIIGNNDYLDQSITSLDEPINDAQKLFDVLTSKYSFSKNNVTLLKNAGYIQMIEAFDKLSSQITENDNLLIFYAGHGWWDETKNLGYWLPVNASKKNTAFWIRNSTISDYMSSIKSKHTLLIADACFSGSIFKTRAAFSDANKAINSLYSLPSRTAMTSGNLKEVPDKSAFLEYLVKRLNNNDKKYLTADQLFVSFRIAVMNNSNTEPQFGTIQNAGDEGGEFIFVKKN